jgi:hypothetical protein
MAVTLNGTSGLVFNDGSAQDTAATGFGFKNSIINSAMVIDQRNAGASYSAIDSTYGLDRWKLASWDGSSQVTGKYTVIQSSTVPTGFSTSMLITSSAATTIGAGAIYWVGQMIEGYNTADLDFGKATANSITVSFWVRSSLTGTFGGAIANSAHNRSYPFSYTINSANTFEYKTVTITGDTSGTWLTTNGIGIRIFFNLGSGTTYQGTANAWSGSQLTSVTGTTSLLATNGATLYITGVQLEKGSTATSFDYRPYGTELQLAQRYFEKSVNQGTSITKNAETSFFATVPSTTVANSVTYATQRYVATKRTAPTVLVYPYTTATNTTRISTDGGTDLAANSAFVNATSDAFFSIANTSGGTITTGAQLIFIGNWYASAEL